MKLTKALFLFLLIAILFSSIANVVYWQRRRFLSILWMSPNTSLIIHAPFVLGAPQYDEPLLNQSTRMQVYNFVKANPGVHFRGICAFLNLSVGVAQYHLGLLTKAGLISFFRDGRYKRYFSSRKFGKDEMKIISLLRHKTAGKILSLLTEISPVSHIDLASKIGISSQALTWHMNRLRKMRLVDFVTEGMKVKYLLDQEKSEILNRCFDFMS